MNPSITTPKEESDFLLIKSATIPSNTYYCTHGGSGGEVMPDPAADISRRRERRRNEQNVRS